MPAFYPTLMYPHPLHFISYTKRNFRFLSKDDFSVRRLDLNFRVLKITCKSHSFFILLATNCEKLALYCRENAGLS